MAERSDGDGMVEPEADDHLVDADAREVIRTELDRTLFVEAGAGSGKTTALVARIVALVTADPPVPMKHIAAITFTEKAAAELRDRVRTELSERAASTGGVTAERCEAALAELDGAAVSTLHAFAQRILREHPIEAGLPPGVEILDEVNSLVDFDERWREFVDELLDDTTLHRSLLLARAANIRPAALRDVADAFNANWDLVEQRIEPAPAPPTLVVDDMADRLDHLRARTAGIDADDKMVRQLDDLAGHAAELRSSDDETELLRLLGEGQPSIRTNLGTKKCWIGHEDELDALRHDLAAWKDDAAARRHRHLDAAVWQLVARIGRFTVHSAAERARGGRLEFHDLLVMARRLLRDPDHGAGVRGALRDRYRRLLIDEFQDTDPIQIDLATLLTTTDPDAGDRVWSDLRPEPGRLFFVGDPKQSIYRFRRADIATFLEAGSAFVEAPLQLTQNFRTTAPVIDWVNTVFGDLIVADGTRQPSYVPLAPRRPVPPSGPAVVHLGIDEHADVPKAEELRDREADDVAATVARAIDEGWAVEAGGGWRPARLGDVTILVPSRISLPHLERALDAHGVQFRVDSSSLVYTTREVRDLLAAARAVDDPTDSLSLVTALRSSAFGCGDDDLYRYRVLHGGTWNHQGTPPDGLPSDDPVVEAMAYLGELHRQRWWMTPSQLLDRIARDRRVFELGVLGGRHRDVWRRLRFVIDQARAYSEAMGGSLRQFLTWARLQGDDNARVSEAILPETDTDSVRIMTIHAAKGLEFPICVLSGLSTARNRRRSGVQVGFDAMPEATERNGIHLRFGKDYESDQYEEFADTEDLMGHHERLRLLYVAATRARDHLVVSLHRAAPKVRQDGTTREVADADRTSAELLARATAAMPATPAVPSGGAADRVRPPPPDDRPGSTLLEREAWRAERDRRVAVGRRVHTVAATALRPDAEVAVGEADGDQLRLDLTAPAGDPSDDPGLAKHERDLELPPWNKGRYGTAVGRAVHGVLQVVDLASGNGLAELARAQAAAEGVPTRHGVVAALARSALDADVVKRAAVRTHWRELYVAAPVRGSLVEGYVDLLYRDTGGLVVVDHKTDHVADDVDVAHALARYRLQGAAYAFAVQRVTGEPVVRTTFVFCRADGPAVEADIADLEAATDEIGDRVEVVAAAPPREFERV